jgi:hypothetical protein
MSGETTSLQLSLKEQMDQLDTILNQYEQSLGLVIKQDSNIEKYINLGLDEIRKMPTVELAEVSYILSKYSMYIQKQHNIEMVRMNWAEHRIKKIISKELTQYKYSSYDERKQLAIANNEVAQKLDDIRNYAKARSDRISFISSKLNEMSRSLNELQKARRNQNE